jgi:GNAT superfamily N-acetyltransferase
MTYTHKNTWNWGQTHTIVWWNGVGLVNVSVENETPERATIHGVSVLPSYRKHGYGTTLLTLAEKEAKKMGATRVGIATEPNSWLEDWYKRLGYEFDSYDENNLIVLSKNL